MHIFSTAPHVNLSKNRMNKSKESQSVKIAREVFGIKESEIKEKGIEDYIALADIMISILKYTPDQVKDFIFRLSKLEVGIHIDRKLPEDCIEVVGKIESLIKWHRDGGYHHFGSS